MTTTDDTTRHTTYSNTAGAVAWLEAPLGLAYNLALAESGASVRIQPMFTLKSPFDAGRPMIICADDYRDPMRWWL